MYEDLPNLDSFAAGSQCILKRLPAADYADATQFLGKVDSDICAASGSGDALFRKGEMPQTGLDNLFISQSYSKSQMLCSAPI